MGGRTRGNVSDNGWVTLAGEPPTEAAFHDVPVLDAGACILAAEGSNWRVPNWEERYASLAESQWKRATDGAVARLRGCPRVLATGRGDRLRVGETGSLSLALVPRTRGGDVVGTRVSNAIRNDKGRGRVEPGEM